MAAILGLGMTHSPLLTGRDADMTRILRRVLGDPALPETYRRPAGWPEPMRREWGDDEGLSAARRHRQVVVPWFREARRRLDDFAPDVVVIWGDDQYENFREDIIPPFCVLAYYKAWRQAPLAALENSGQQEMLNWMCLAGAMAELGRQPDKIDFVATYIFNAPKCFAIFGAESPATAT